MRHRIVRTLLALAAFLPAIAAAQPSPNSPAAKARADNGRPPFTAADVSFMSGMIGHHAQAVVMAGWAPTHGASRAVQALAERIVVAQRDEIAYMQRWLRERAQPVPAGDAMHDTMPGMEGMQHELMPGMLTREQLAALNASRGADFDRLFLQDMIQHHQGALTMVQRLLASTGAAQDDDVYRFVADVSADQSTEIDRMNTMLDAMPKKP
jgi:uncharacterized protein (DUF305 family)